MKTIFKGLIISPKSKTKLDIYNPGYLVVSEKGLIEEITDRNPRKKYKGYKFEDFSNYLICPGFVDTHNHLPQYAFAGIGEKDLLPWLKKYTFPREKMFKNRAVAQKAATVFFRDLIKNGTTTTMTYVTTHKTAADIAFRISDKIGIRAIIGKVMMDRNSPSYLQEKTEKSLQESIELIDKWHGHNNRLFYVLTPRFAITCSAKMMGQIGNIAKEKGVYIQTHLSENKNEIDTTKKLFPKAKSYTDVYRLAGLLGPKTIMAHCIHLTKPEISMLKESGTKIAHCPTSNRFLGSGIMPFRTYQQKNLVMGLGTDVAGGYSLSMINEMKEAIENSKILSHFTNGKISPPMTIPEAFCLATLGGAKTLSMDKEIGSLSPGKKADFIIIDHLKADPMGKQSKYTNPEQILSKVIYRGDSSIIKRTYIGGIKA